MPNIYIILVCWNNHTDLPFLFASLDKVAEHRPGLNWIIIDNGSQDNSVQTIKAWTQNKPAVKFFQNRENLGFTGGNNQGIVYALENGADYIVLLNCDTAVQTDFIDQALGAFKQDKQIGIVQSPLMRFHDKNQVQSFGNALHYLGFGYSVGDGEPLERFAKHTIQSVDYASFSAVTIKRQVFEDVGLLDENYVSYHEDTDFCLHARLAGHQIALQPRSVVYHNYTFPLGQTTNQNKLRYFWMERNRFLILLKFYKFPTLLIILPAFLFMEAGQIFFSCLNGFFVTRLKVYTWLIKNFKLISKARKEIQIARKFGDRRLFQHMTGRIEFQSVSNPLLKFIGNPLLNIYFKIIKYLIIW